MQYPAHLFATGTSLVFA